MDIVRLQRNWGFLRRGDGIELISWLHGDRLLFRSHVPDKILAALTLLSAGVPSAILVREIAQSTGLAHSIVHALLRALFERGALVLQHLDSTQQEQENRYSRQIEFLRFFETQDVTGEMYQERLQKARVAVVGLGGYGTWIALLTAMSGISKIVAIDPDVVEPSNLNRQVLFRPGDIGKRKVDAAAEAISALESGTVLEGHALRIGSAKDLVPLLAEVDLVFDPFDYVPPTHLYPTSMHIVQAAKAARVPTLSLGASWVGPLTFPGESPCYWCLSANDELRHALTASYAISDKRHEGRAASFVPRIVVPVGIAVYEASRYLAGIDNSSLASGVVMIDQHRHLRDRLVPIMRNEDCEVCGYRGGDC